MSLYEKTQHSIIEDQSGKMTQEKNNIAFNNYSIIN